MSKVKIDSQEQPQLLQKPKSTWAYFSEIAVTSGQISVATLVSELIWNINLCFIGNMSDERLLAAAGLSDMLIYLSGGLFVIGLNEGFSSLAGRAFGASHFSLMSDYLTKALFLNTISFIFPIIIAIFGDKILIFLHQDPQVSSLARDYLICLLPVIFFQYIYDLLRAYLNCMEIYHVHSIGSMITTTFHPFVCWMCLPLGMKGIALASTITHGINLSILIFYIILIKPCPQSLPGQNKSFNLQTLPKYFMNVSPIALPICFDACFYACKTFIVGAFKQPSALAAHVLLANIFEIFYCISLGINLALNTLSANAVGERDNRKCRLLLKFAYFSGLLLGGVFIVFFLCFSEGFFSFFTNQKDVLRIMNELTPIIACFVGFDYTQSALQGIIKGVGLGDEGFWATAISYWMIGLPGCYLLGMYFQFGLKGVWIGYGIATILLFLLNSMILSRINWNSLIEEKYLEMQEEKILMEKEEQDFNDEFEAKQGMIFQKV